MDPHSTSSSLKTPSEMTSVVIGSRLQYPDPFPLDDITKDLTEKAHVSPVDASETVLVTVPVATAHLVDRQASVHLESGPFSIVRLNLGGNGMAVFAGVGKDLLWPLTKDQAAVKVDPFHYFFSVEAPPEIEEEECGSLSPEKEDSDANESFSSSSSEDSLLSYGITFSPSSDMECLQQLDDVLQQYCCFEAPKVTPQSEDEGNAPNVVAGEVSAEDYWTLLAPDVEDYSSRAAKAIASGAGDIVRGIFWVSNTTIAQLKKGNLFMQGRVKAKNTPTKISARTMRRVKRVQRISARTKQTVKGVLSGVLKAAAFITRPLATSKTGQKLLSRLPGQVALATFDGVGSIFDALEVAGKNVLLTSAATTAGLVEQRYGKEAGQLAEHSIDAVGGFLATPLSVSKLRKVFHPSSEVKSAVRTAGSGRRLKKECAKAS